MSKIPINLKPIPGFCIKTTSLQPTVYTPVSPYDQNVLEPTPRPIPIPTGFKIFINIAWDANVPPPPVGSEQVIQRAMRGEDIDDRNPDGWYVPVVVSEGRPDKDKAGKPSLVFDCVYNKSVKLRTLTDPEFKLFIIELALQRLEAQTSLVLSRDIGTPNIASKGNLTPSTILIPSFLLAESPSSPLSSAISPRGPSPVSKKPLIQEVPTLATSTPKGILKTISPTSSPTSQTQHFLPTWKWSKEGTILRIVVSIPRLSRAIIEQVTLDIEPRRFILQVPDYHILDVNLDQSDAEIVAGAPFKASGNLENDGSRGPNNILTLKRQRDLDVEGATSEWHVTDSILVINA